MNKFKKIICALVLPILIGTAMALPSSAAYESGDTSDQSGGLTVGDVRVSSRIWELLFGRAGGDANYASADVLIPGGDVFGARIREGHVTVTEDNATLGLKCGDIILKVDGHEVSSVTDVRALILSTENGSVVLTVKRGKECFECTAPLVGDDKKLGVVLRDGAAGIGTVTYIDPDDFSFGGLGHGICDSDSGEIIEMERGIVTGVILGGVQKGEKGHPGELCGILTDREHGVIYDNTDTGIFGRIESEKLDTGAAIPVGSRSDVTEGAAKIISTVKNGKKAEYAIEIFDIDTGADGAKCFKIRVTDPTLLALTGGIVRGMSGSPIIQDGKLVGAVTHVMVADPTEGYGIFIENMLNAAESQVQPKAA